MTEQIAAMEERLLDIRPSSFRLAGRSFLTRGDEAQDPPVDATCGDEASCFLAEASSHAVEELTRQRRGRMKEAELLHTCQDSMEHLGK